MKFKAESTRKKISVIDLSSSTRDITNVVKSILNTEDRINQLQTARSKCTDIEKLHCIDEELRLIEPTKNIVVFGFGKSLKKVHVVCVLIALSRYIDTLTLGRQKPDAYENYYFNAAGPDENHFEVLSSSLVLNSSIKKLKLRCAPDISLLEKIALVFVDQAKMKETKLRSFKLRTELVIEKPKPKSKVSKFYLFGQTLAANKNFLEYLHLSGNLICDQDMDILTGLGCSLSGLCAIKIYGSSVTDQGALLLHDLSFLTPISINFNMGQISPKLLDQINKDGVIKTMNDADWEQLKYKPYYFSLSTDLQPLMRKFYASATRQVTSFFKSTDLPQEASKHVTCTNVEVLEGSLSSITPSKN